MVKIIEGDRVFLKDNPTIIYNVLAVYDKGATVLLHDRKYYHISEVKLYKEIEHALYLNPIISENTNKAKRFNTSKVGFTDIPILGLVEVAKVGAYGRNKYSKYNWKKEAPTSQYIDCALRHIIKYMYGEKLDSESKQKHLSHAAWNLLALLEKQQLGWDKDDLYEHNTDVNIEDLFKLDETKICKKEGK